MTPDEIKLLVNDYDGDLVYMFDRLRKLEDVAIQAKKIVELNYPMFPGLRFSLEALDEE